MLISPLVAKGAVFQVRLNRLFRGVNRLFTARRQGGCVSGERKKEGGRDVDMRERERWEREREREREREQRWNYPECSCTMCVSPYNLYRCD